MKKVFLFTVLAALLAFAGCKKEILPIDETRDVSTVFAFQAIEYLLDDESVMGYVIKKSHPITTFYNNTPTEQVYIYKSVEHTYNSSEFWSNDERAFKFIGDVPKVEVPWYISGNIIEVGSWEWDYAEGKQRQEPWTWTVSEIRIPPHNVMTLNVDFRYKSLTTRYRLHLKGVEAGEEVAVDGLWSGLFLEHLGTDVKIEPLN